MLIRTKQMRLLRNSCGGVDEIQALFVDMPGNDLTWAGNAILISFEQNPFAPFDPLPSLEEVTHRLTLHFQPKGRL